MQLFGRPDACPMTMSHHAARDQDIGNNGGLVLVFFAMMCSVVSSSRSSKKADVPMSPLPPFRRCL